MNVKNLEAVIKLIEAEKMFVEMIHIFSVKRKDSKPWIERLGWDPRKPAYFRYDPPSPDDFISVSDEMTKLPTKEGKGEFGCNTAGCIAGHALVAMPKKSLKITGHWALIDKAQKWLGLTDVQADRLFHKYGWPTNYKEAYEIAFESGDIKLTNAITAARIRHFIATKGRE
jgi:hypothetical protein